MVLLRQSLKTIFSDGWVFNAVKHQNSDFLQLWLVSCDTWNTLCHADMVRKKGLFETRYQIQTEGDGTVTENKRALFFVAVEAWISDINGCTIALFIAASLRIINECEWNDAKLYGCDPFSRSGSLISSCKRHVNIRAEIIIPLIKNCPITQNVWIGQPGPGTGSVGAHTLTCSHTFCIAI